MCSNEHLKIAGSFKKYHSMMIKLQEMTIKIKHQLAQQSEDIFRRFDRIERALRDLRSELAPFLWCLVFKSM